MDDMVILQNRLPEALLSPRALPGIAPLDPDEWLIRDDAYAGQMALRRKLIATRPRDVIAQLADAAPAVDELLQTALDFAPRIAAQRRGDHIGCPDGVEVAFDPAHPLETLGSIFQNDFCILQKFGNEHVLTAAVLCFPASWRLSEKIGHPLIAIHAPVADYDANIARRVQRLFDGVKPGRPLWRSNLLFYDDPSLHQPRSYTAPRPRAEREQAPYLRAERQTLLRLPQTGAVIFGIHTYVVRAQTAV